MTIPREVQDASADPKRRFNHYVLISPVGSGGAGEVWRSWDLRLNRWVAVKLLREDVGETQRGRFLREAQATAAVRHPNLITIHDFGEANGRLFLVMEYIPGKTLDLAAPLKGVVSNLRQVAAALETAHRSGVVHRDLKPGNIVVDEGGIPHVVDFGLAHWIETSLQITQMGSTLGTPQYMSPEQAAGRVSEIGPATDVYALGVMLYEALARRPMFETQNAGEFIASIINREPAPPPGPRDLVAICLKATEKRPARRYGSTGDLASDLEAYLEGRPVVARPVHPLVRRFRSWRGRRVAMSAVAAVVVVAAAVFWAVSSGRQAVRETAAREKLETQRRFREMNREIEMKVADLRKDVYIAGIDIHAGQVRLEKELEAYEVAAASGGFSGEPDFWKILGGGWTLVGHQERALSALRKARELAPADPVIAGDLGRIYLEKVHIAFLRFGITSATVQTGDTEELLGLAEACFKSARVESGGDLRHEVISIYAGTLRGDAREDSCDVAIRKFGRTPGVEEFHLLKGILAGTDLNFKGAIASFTTCLEIRPHDARPYFWRGYARMITNELPEALADLERVTYLNPRFVEAWFLNANIRVKMKDLEGAKQAYTDGLEHLAANDLRRVVGLNNRANVRHSLGDIDGALADWTEVIRLSPGIPEVYRDRAATYAARGEIERARADFETSLRIFPRNGKALAGLATVHWDEGREAEAMEEYLKAFEMNPKEEIVRGGLDYALRVKWDRFAKLKDTLPASREALAEMERILAINGEWGRLHFYLGFWHQQVGLLVNRPGSLADESTAEFALAVKGFDRALELNTEEVLVDEILLARASTRRSWARVVSEAGGGPGEFLDKAVADFEAVLVRNPRSEAARMNRAYLYFEWGKFEQVNGRNGRPYFEKAERDADQAEKINPADPKARELLGRIREAMK